MESHLVRASRLGFSHSRIEREKVLSLAQTGRVHEVESYLPSMLVDPGEDVADICASYVSGYCLSFDFDSATVLLEAWAKDSADDPEPHVRFGDVWYSQNEWKEAIPNYRRAIAIAPRNVKAQLSLAQCLLRIYEPAEAEKGFRIVIREDPENAEALEGLGTCLMSQSRLEDARTAFLAVIDRNPGHLEARRRLGELELALERPERAVDWLKPLVDAWPEDKAYCSLYAQALQEIGRVEEARPWWEAVRQAETALGKLEKLNESVKNDPTNPELRYEIGSLLLRFRSRDDGAGWFKSLLQFDPTHARAHEALAEYYEKTGQIELSRQHRQLAREYGGGNHAS